MKNLLSNISLEKIFSYGFILLVGSFAFYGIVLALISALAGGTSGHVSIR